LPETVQRLSDLSNIIGIKEANGCLRRMVEIRSRCRKDFLIFTGEDSNACEAILQGADGVISVTANIAPALMQRMCAAALAKDVVQAEGINQRLALLHKVLFVESNPIACKWSLATMGLISSGIRLPLRSLASMYHSPVSEALKLAGVMSV